MYDKTANTVLARGGAALARVRARFARVAAVRRLDQDGFEATAAAHPLLWALGDARAALHRLVDRAEEEPDLGTAFGRVADVLEDAIDALAAAMAHAALDGTKAADHAVVPRGIAPSDQS